MKSYNIAVVGATGLVGRTMLQVLAERNFPLGTLRLFASERSAGKTIRFMGKDYPVFVLEENSFQEQGLELALFSAGGGISKEFIPPAAAQGVVCIDNSSAWRMEEGVPLIVPEVNPEALAGHRGIIANPNCSTIQSVVALNPLKRWGIKRVVYSSYQAVSGSGQRGLTDLDEGRQDFYPYPITGNVLPHIDSFLEDGYTKEERKMMDESRKILHLPELAVTATTVRVPVRYGHGVSINVQLAQPYELSELRAALAGQAGLVVQDDPASSLYPMPITAEGHDEVFVGRIRRDDSVENGVNLWVVADNVRKGAAVNAVQIAQRVLEAQA